MLQVKKKNSTEGVQFQVNFFHTQNPASQEEATVIDRYRYIDICAFGNFFDHM